MSPGPGSAESRDVLLDEDFHCLNCGYNLRGLDGDPLRCPECFQQNRIEDLLCPPASVRRRVRKMHRCADLCVLISSIWLASFVAAGILGQIGFPVCAFLVLVMPWGICVTEFKNACLAEPGWRRVLLGVHAHGMLLLLAAMFLALLLVWGMHRFLGTALSAYAWLPPAAVAAAFVSAQALARKGVGRRVDKIERLAKRATCFEREELRRRARER